MTYNYPSANDTKVAIILPSLLPFGGVEKNFIPRINWLIANGYDVDVVLINEPNDTVGCYPEGCNIINLGCPKLRNSIVPLVQYLKKQRPQFVHVAIWPLTIIAVFAKLLAGVSFKLIVSDHNPLSLQYASWGRTQNLMLRLSLILFYRFADHRMVVSKGVANDLSKLSLIPKEKFIVIYNTIKLTNVNNNEPEITDKLWNPNAKYRIVTAGHLKQQKNHMLLVRAFKQVLEKQDAQLIILGQGDLESDIKAMISNLNLGDKIIMPGHVSSPADYYNSADLFVLSSDYEGFGNVIVEAMLCGLPVVSTDCPYGPSEILDGGKYGKLVPVGDEDAMATAMLEALEENIDPEILKTRAEKVSGAESLDAYQKLFIE